MPISPALSQGALLAIQTTRFERLDVYFEHPNGLQKAGSVARGSFGRNWRVGGQIAFSTSLESHASAVWLRIEGLSSYELLELRLVSQPAARHQFELTAFAIGAALALLGVAALFNFGLSIGLRQSFFLWHGGWAATIMVWGIVWSQVGLTVFPELAGTTSNRLATGLACLAILLATLATAAALRRASPRWARQLLIGLGILVFFLGILSCLPGANISRFAIVLGIGTLACLAWASVCIVSAWRSGHPEGRDLAISWTIPMTTLAVTQIVDLSGVLWGGGDRIVMLSASALQVVGLTALAAARLGYLRIERDIAIETGAKLAKLAERDPLTGLLNRRGFLARCSEDYGELVNVPFGLLLIDLDRFKLVNDRFGHQAGDDSLIILARKLLTLEHRYPCRVGRLGGEEFVVGVSGLAGAELYGLGEALKVELADCDFSAIAPALHITASIGIAEGVADGPFEKLYPQADKALYAAKHAGRNSVVSFDRASAGRRDPTVSYEAEIERLGV
ncbi:GGDEF domain-containing protein [Qipengyuania sp. NPDC077410]|uniref:GGDEF domain-containing protein n=1 Tax=Qipengyuania sp. NPDC077410 TaxID=3364496 RepID=UPI0037C9FC5D